MRSSRLLLLALMTAAALLLPAVASADGVTWTLEGVTFNDGGGVSGSFNFNQNTTAYSAIDLVSTSGSILGGNTYTTQSSAFFSTATLLGVGPAQVIAGDYSNLTFLELFFTNPLTNDGGTDPVYAVEIFCADATCSDQMKRDTSEGYVTTAPVAAPEPASLLLLLSGLFALLLFRPRA